MKKCSGKNRLAIFDQHQLNRKNRATKFYLQSMHLKYKRKNFEIKTVVVGLEWGFLTII